MANFKSLAQLHLTRLDDQKSGTIFTQQKHIVEETSVVVVLLGIAIQPKISSTFHATNQKKKKKKKKDLACFTPRERLVQPKALQ